MSCSIAVIIDRSGSMGASGYLAPAQTDANTFINVMNPGDSLGVVSFNGTASIVYGTSTALTSLTAAGQSTACTAVSAITSSGNTNMVAAFTTTAAMMANSSAPMGEIFLSDGMYNVGGNPVPGLATTPPIYTIALGPNGQQKTLSAIASKTGGTYNYAPNALQLAEIYNTIASQTSVAVSITNTQTSVASDKFVGTDGVVPSGATQATFSVNWDDDTVTYTPNTPSDGEVNVFLTDPNGNTVTTTATGSGPGFVVFKIASPLVGTYTAYAWYAASSTGSSTLAYTAGIFEIGRAHV